ncbi:MAG: methionine adenosyltransferase [Candidatus Thermoplasmatota archaeon]|nr:methionine adenosyltransferase [Candidatus Thermoplasmatota archaeon]
MTKNIFVEPLTSIPIEQQRTEIVERKGFGHPDSIADGIGEVISRELSREYIRRFGKIMHHNVDKVQIAAGKSYPRFGGGEVTKPILVTIAGRATDQVKGDHFPVRPIALRACAEYLRKFRYFDPESMAVIDCKIGPGSDDLIGVFEHAGEKKVPLANDTSFGVGFAPMSETENLVMRAEKLINNKYKLPQVGQDVKVMGLRTDNNILLTVAAAMVGTYIKDGKEYASIKEQLREKLLDDLCKYTDRELDININTADDYNAGIYYLTVTGLDMENGDDGAIGRGNRVNGLITPCRPMSLEAAAGKNPVSHVGKIYNILGFRMAEDIVKVFGGDVVEAHVNILAQIGKPINHPRAAVAKIIPADGRCLDKMEQKVNRVVDEWLDRCPEITEGLVAGKINVF